MRRWPFVALWVGFVFQVLAWMLVTPPYATYDELDHVFRVSSVWNGNLTTAEAPDATATGLVEVDRQLVDDATAECLALTYTSADRCRASGPVSDDTVAIPSGAAFYHPLYYLAISPSAALGHGAATVQWMRASSLVLTAAVLGLALWCASRWPQPDRAVRGLLVAAPPMVFISMSVVAPNGLEMAGGLLLWVALITLTGESPTARTEWVALWIGIALLSTLRSLGPLFVLAVLVVMALWRGPQLARLWRAHRRACVATLAVAVVFLCQSAAWILTQHAPRLTTAPAVPDADLVDSWMMSVRHLPDMARQFVAAIGGRGVLPSALVVGAWLVAFGLLAIDVGRSTWRGATAWVALCGVVLCLPLAFQTLVFHELGYVWQSRYLLPLAFGIPVIAALLNDASALRSAVTDVVLVFCIGMVQISILGSAIQWYREQSPSVGAGSFPFVPSTIALSLLVLGVAIGFVGLAGARRTNERDELAHGSRGPALPQDQAMLTSLMSLH